MMDRKFYELTVCERLARLVADGAIDEADAAVLRDPAPLTVERANALIENVVGTFALPLGVARNFLVNGREVAVPMAIEEASVVAAASNGARLLRAGGGIRAEADPSLMIGQVQLLDVADPEAATRAILGAADEVLALANAGHARLVAAGGGAQRLVVRSIAATAAGPMLIVEIEVDVRDAMGANAVNSMCEAISGLLAARASGRAGLRILSNLCDRRLARAWGRVPASALGGPEGVRGIVEASAFAEADPYRAATHNKGIMNGVDALLLATGQDWRAAEAGAHAFAARGGRYGALATWRRDESGDLAGRLEIPLALGVVGGGTDVHPVAAVARRLVGARTARDLAEVAAAVGLAQNLAAIRALAQEGIQRGHMALHGRARGRA
jgi:hydroxymethylglutaryl-CoA reductase